MAGFSGEEIDALDSDMNDEEFQETVRKRLIGSLVNNGNNQRVFLLIRLRIIWDVDGVLWPN